MIDIHRLREVFSYEPETGNLVWKIDRGTRASAGDIAGFINSAGYIAVGIDGEQILGHRVAWALHYGEWPNDEVDHRDGVRSNNRLDNLRPATHAENMRNKGIHKNNTSGTSGVWFNKSKSRWRADIKLNGKKINLGSFGTREEASKRCLEARPMLHEFQEMSRHIEATP